MSNDDHVKQIGLSNDGRVDFSACRQRAEQVCAHEPAAPAPITPIFIFIVPYGTSLTEVGIF